MLRWSTQNGGSNVLTTPKWPTFNPPKSLLPELSRLQPHVGYIRRFLQLCVGFNLIKVVSSTTRRLKPHVFPAILFYHTKVSTNPKRFLQLYVGMPLVLGVSFNNTSAVATSSRRFRKPHVGCYKS